MKVSLWRAVLNYTKTKGTIPLDERQMDTLKSLYMELAKSLLMGFMVFTVFYGYMELRDGETSINFIVLSASLIGTIAYYYTLRFCYLNVIGLDENFEVVLVPAFIFTPMMIFQTFLTILEALYPALKLSTFLIILIFVICLLITYFGANCVYKKGVIQQEKEMVKGELRYRTRKQFVNFAISLSIVVACLPLSYDEVFLSFMIAACFFVFAIIIYYGFMNPHNVYILNEFGITYYKALWNKHGGFIAFDNIENVVQQGTLNFGYAKDKIKILCKDGKHIYLYPENAYQFYSEIKNNL